MMANGLQDEEESTSSRSYWTECDGIFTFNRDEDVEPYWLRGKVPFWPLFLSKYEQFDHVYLIDIFKLICGDAGYRRIILQQSLQCNKILCNNYKSYSESDSRAAADRRSRGKYGVDGLDRATSATLKNIEKAWKLSQITKERGFFTFQYPPVLDTHGDCVSHYIMLVVDPAAPRPTSGTRSGGGKARRFLGTVYHIDSRGPSYARRMHPVWRRCEQQLRAGIFRQCRWLSVVREDLQAAGHVEDHFCQTWSLLIAIELSHLKPAAKAQAARTRTGRGDGDDGGGGFVFCPGGPGLTHILRFLRRILTIDTIAECAYDEIYHRTHTADDGQRHYERYFSTLEQLATASAGDGRSSYYPHGVTYRASGYTFLEDFLDCLDCELLENILA